MDSPFARLTLPARIDSMQAFRDFVRVGAESAGLEAPEMDWLDLVLEEILVNIARYAYQPETGDTEVRYAVEQPGKLLVEISDGGRVFNPLVSDPPVLGGGLAERPIGGLGVFLVKNIVGSLSYRREQDRNTISFTFPGPNKGGA
ncbi:MAG TPA: ATP-binding protein [Bryobacteraceae bacterium]|jgi:anti-sigma regulatory factor (Ser/Thr protein kinase)|nr:ATP-binding protein [Bryobacteraceae bacterium]